MYHSHPATRQDEWVFDRTPGQRGFFVEVGAHDGVRHSNTLALEKDGWSGLLIEANPSLYSQMVVNRPKALHSNAVVSNWEREDAGFILGDSYGGLLDFMPREWMDEHVKRGNPVVRVPTRTLASVLEEHKCSRVMKYLSIDVEGAEFAILEQFIKVESLKRPQHQTIFQLITVEFRYDTVLLDKLERLLTDYRLDELRGFDACFVHRSLR